MKNRDVYARINQWLHHKKVPKRLVRPDFLLNRKYPFQIMASLINKQIHAYF